MGRGLVLLLGILLFALPASGQQQATAAPASQAAFRAAMVKYQGLGQAETNALRRTDLVRDRGVALARALGEGLAFQRWRMTVADIDRFPAGDAMLTLRDPAMSTKGGLTPIFWNGGSGPLEESVAILPGTPIFERLRTMKAGDTIIVSGEFFPDVSGGPIYTTAKGGTRSDVEDFKKFNMPFFVIRIAEIQ